MAASRGSAYRPPSFIHGACHRARSLARQRGGACHTRSTDSGWPVRAAARRGHDGL